MVPIELPLISTDIGTLPTVDTSLFCTVDRFSSPKSTHIDCTPDNVDSRLSSLKNYPPLLLDSAIRCYITLLSIQWNPSNVNTLGTW